MNEAEQRAKARAFVETWTQPGTGGEKQDTQSFWLGLLGDVFGVERAYQRYITFEKVPPGFRGFIDGFIPDAHVLLEQKSRGIPLDKVQEQSDGTTLTPYGQAKRYADSLKHSEHPRWIVTCNFDEFWVYDQEKPGEEPEKLLLTDLPEKYPRLSFLVDRDKATVPHEEEISVKAGKLIGDIFRALKDQYDERTPREVVDESLNVICVRLAFCFYAEDAELFSKHLAFHDYLAGAGKGREREALIELFNVLDTPEAERDPYMNEELAAFPYVSGGLFSKERRIVIPKLNDKLLNLILVEASESFDWKDISPTIFGAIFESSLNPETQRQGGMHYTTPENIHRVIDPLFLNAFRRELSHIKTLKVEATRNKAILAFQEKLGSLTFLDPACGSGNFLTETYLCLRTLENDALRLLSRGQGFLGDGFSPIRVKIQQFFGIEINGFAKTVAKTALWIAEHQMIKETMDIVQHDLPFLPLKSYTNIREGNALKIDWSSVSPSGHFDFVMGNPPFVGARLMSREQKSDLQEVFGENWRNAGDIDYVGCWFKKAADLMRTSPATRTAFVATNSICQGASVANLWAPLAASGIGIDFAWRTFVWNSEAINQAHVYCVIVGFSMTSSGGGALQAGSSTRKTLPIRPGTSTPTWPMRRTASSIRARSRSVRCPRSGSGTSRLTAGTTFSPTRKRKTLWCASPGRRNFSGGGTVRRSSSTTRPAGVSGWESARLMN